MTAIFAAFSGYTLYMAFSYSGDISSYSSKFQSLQSTSSGYNSTKDMLLHFNTVQLGWALTGIVSICLVVLFLVIVLFFSKQ